MEVISNLFLFREAVAILSDGRNVKIRLVGQSMLPFLCPECDILTIGPCRKMKLRIGDVVFANYHGNYILHRIVKIGNDNAYYLRGDACRGECEEVGRRDIAGVLISIKRKELIIVCYDNYLWRLKGVLWVKGGFIRMVWKRMKRVVKIVMKT